MPAGDRALPLKSLSWQHLADGGMATRVEVLSANAAAIRIGISMPETHPDIVLRFVGSALPSQVFGPYPANKLAQSRMYWSPVLEGDTGTIEIYLPSGVEPSSVQIFLPQISHLVAAGTALLKDDPAGAIGRSGTCESDVACFASAAIKNQAKAVARTLWTDSGNTYLCSGTLLNDSSLSMTPYFFTASHCSESQAIASTYVTYWFFDALACGSRATPSYVVVAGGAMLLGRSEDYDWSLMRLNSPPPNGAVFSAWRAEPLSQNTAVSVVHHPEGDLKKYSQGVTPNYFTFSDGSSYAQARYTQGTTEGGSSGSGLLTLAAGGNFFELRGGLFGGDASCANPNGTDYYSRLDVALPLLRQYLTPTDTSHPNSVVVVEFYNAGLRHYFISADAAEINDLDTGVHAGWVRTGLRFLAYANATGAPAGTTPVCRFYRSPQFGDSHFYSASPGECAATKAAHPVDWVYESASVFYLQLPNQVTGACPVNTRPVYRFFNPATTNHRYTAEVDVRNTLIAQGGLTQEGYGNPPNQVIMCSPTS